MAIIRQLVSVYQFGYLDRGLRVAPSLPLARQGGLECCRKEEWFGLMGERYFLFPSLGVAVLRSPSPTADAQALRGPIPQSNGNTSQNRAAPPGKHRNTEKQKRWSGSLVDAACMVKATSGTAAPDQGSSRSDAGETQRELREPMPENGVAPDGARPITADGGAPSWPKP